MTCDRRRDWEAGLDRLTNGAYWEAHEDLEDLWRALPESEAREATQALIQFAAACYKVRQAAEDRAPASMRAGMEKLIEMARGHLDDARERPEPAPAWEPDTLRHALDELDRIRRHWATGTSLTDVQRRIEETATGLADELRSVDSPVDR